MCVKFLEFGVGFGIDIMEFIVCVDIIDLCVLIIVLNYWI